MINTTLGSLKNVITAKQYYCGCVKRQQRRFIAGQNLFSNISTNMKMSHVIKTSLGGKINFGNCYLGQQPLIDSLGSVEGQPGGSFSPVRNKF
jgi:hypothetical protein